MKRWMLLCATLALVFGLVPMAGVEAAEPGADKDIVEVLEADGRFTALLQALQTSRLQPKLKTEGPFTLFAPPDDAFLKLHDAYDTDELMEIYSEVDKMMMYHVMTDTVMSADMALLNDAPTLLPRRTLTVTVQADQVMLNDATVTEADILASNGVIHVIDTILLVPPGEPASITTTAGAEIWSSYDTVFPLPPDVQNFTGQGGESQVNFQTSLTLEELLDFYRTELGARGLVERIIGTSVTDQVFSIVFDGWPNGEALVIQSVDLGESRNVNMRFEKL
jgi:uncharacterized surface protein with fasciclin (FAS1) repeats